MASIRQKRDRWQVVFGTTDASGKRRQVTRSFATRAEATAFREDVERRLGRTVAPPPRVTVRALAERFFSWCAEGRTATTTTAIYRRAVGYALPALGDMPIERVTAEQFDALYGRLLAAGGADGQGLQPRTVRLTHRSLHRMFSLAVKWRLLTANPAALATSPTVPFSRATAPSLEQVAKLIAVARPEPYPVICALAVATGLRRGELCGLRWSDIDTELMTLTVSQVAISVDSQYELRPVPKTKSAARTIGIDAGLLDILMQWRGSLAEQMLKAGFGAHPDALLFPDLRIGPCAPRAPDVVSAMISRFGKEAGLPEGATGLHGLRHRHASSLMHLPIRMVADRLGHSTIVITGNLYQHGDDATRRATSDAAAVAFGDVVQLAKAKRSAQPTGTNESPMSHIRRKV